MSLYLTLYLTFHVTNYDNQLAKTRALSLMHIQPTFYLNLIYHDKTYYLANLDEQVYH